MLTPAGPPPAGDAATQVLQALTAGAQAALARVRARAHLRLAQLRTPSAPPAPPPGPPP